MQDNNRNELTSMSNAILKDLTLKLLVFSGERMKHLKISQVTIWVPLAFCAVVIVTTAAIGIRPAHAILGGSSKINRYYNLPFVAILTNRVGTEKRGVCAGTLIDKTTVLTAAHCFDNANTITRITVVRAVYMYAQDRYTQQVSKSQIHIHPDYSESVSGGPGDIAVVKLLNDNVPDKEYIVYPTLSSSTIFENHVIWGYGLDENKRIGNLKVVSKPNSQLLSTRAKEEHLLRFDQTDLRGVSGGDSGGPVLAIVNHVAYIIAVINTATTKKGGVKGSNMGFMTKLTPSIIKWVQSHM